MEHVLKRACVLLLLFHLAAPAAAPAAKGRAARTVSGTVYFTNDSPPKRVYHFKLYTLGMKRVVAAQKPNGTPGFEFRNIRPGRYILTVTGPYVCGLWYEVDLRRRSKIDMTILGDADCGSHSLPPGMRE